MSETKEMQLIIETYRETFGDDFTMLEVANWAVGKGWLQDPPPESPRARLAKKLSRAAREQTKHDEVTHLPYRVNHAHNEVREGEQITLWIDIDRAPREPMTTSMTQRRQQVVGDVVQMSHDADHWNRINPNEEPIELEFDFRPDVKWAKAAPSLN